MASSTKNNKNRGFGGLKVANTDEINSKFICERCQLVLYFPYQFLCCGALLCKFCLLNGLSNSEPFICPYCHKEQSQKEALLDRGTERELKLIFVVCYSCTWKGLYSDYLKHLEENHADMECDDCHKRFFAINSFEEHRQELCPERSILCGLPDCTNPIKFYDMKSHYLSAVHQRRIVLIISEHHQPRHQVVQDQNHIRFYRDTQENIGIVLSTYDILLDDQTRLTLELTERKINFESMVLVIEEFRKQEKENEKNCKELIETLTTSQNILDNIKRIPEENKISILDANSTVTFPIDHPTTTPFTVTPMKFKTSQYGWIFMLRLCSTIVQNEEYLSIFLSLCNADYYNLIPFPFAYDIYVILYDQSNQQKHITQIFKPDLNSSTLTRPTSDKNDEFGIVKFCPRQYLSDPESIYVKDGVFFIRIFIDFLDTGQNPFQSSDNHQTIDPITTTMVTN